MPLKALEAPRLFFVINPFINAYYHLERSSGSVFENFSAKYRIKTRDLLDESAVQDYMKLLGSPQRISWLFKKAASQSSSINEFREVSEKLTGDWLANIFHILDVSTEKYLDYFKEEAGPKLEEYKVSLVKVEPEIRTRLSKISTIVKKPWRSRLYTVYLIESLSSEYGMGGEPIFDEAISVGIMPIDMATDFVIPHELAHILIGDIVRKTVGEADLPFTGSSDPINEAITQLVAHPPSSPPVSKSEAAEYMRLFWDKWQHYAQNLESYGSFEDIVKELLMLVLKRNVDRESTHDGNGVA